MAPAGKVLFHMLQKPGVLQMNARTVDWEKESAVEAQVGNLAAKALSICSFLTPFF